MPTKILISEISPNSLRSLKYPDERKNPTTAKKRSKVVISEAIPLSLSKRVLPAALLKNLVLIVRYTDFVCEKELAHSGGSRDEL